MGTSEKYLLWHVTDLSFLNAFVHSCFFPCTIKIGHVCNQQNKSESAKQTTQIVT